MSSFTESNGFFSRQLIWIALSLIILFCFSFFDFSFLKRTNMVVYIFLAVILLLLALFVLGKTVNGAQSWFSFGAFSFQPSDLIKPALVLMLAKYFSRRHVEIAHIRHIFISGLYMLVPFLLVFLQPDFGSAMIIFFVWFGMALVSGISKRHLFLVFTAGILAFLALWMFVFAPYQKARIKTFLNPIADIHGAGYNANQSMIAVGSGKLFGKGIGFGTQSRLQFLPQYQTDFIFAAYAEEWGFVGAILLLLLFALLIWRILKNAMLGASNFEMLFGLGLAILFASHIIVNIGMNLGLLPVTGVTLPFMSYGGSHLVAEFASLGILMSMRRYSRPAHRDDMKNEFLGI